MHYDVTEHDEALRYVNVVDTTNRWLFLTSCLVEYFYGCQSDSPRELDHTCHVSNICEAWQRGIFLVDLLELIMILSMTKPVLP